MTLGYTVRHLDAGFHGFCVYNGTDATHRLTTGGSALCEGAERTLSGSAEHLRVAQGLVKAALRARGLLGQIKPKVNIFLPGRPLGLSALELLYQVAIPFMLSS